MQNRLKTAAPREFKVYNKALENGESSLYSLSICRKTNVLTEESVTSGHSWKLKWQSMSVKRGRMDMGFPGDHFNSLP